jgi:uncharacterized membrane protein
MKLMQTLDDLTEKIRTLEAERARLKGEIESLKKVAEERAANLEGELATMRQELRGLREVLGSDADGSTSDAEQTENDINIEAEVEADVDDSAEDPAPTDTNSNHVEPGLDSVLETLDHDEQKVVEVLQAHNGKYSQKNIRVEAKLSWLQANRIISRLAEQGVVSIDRSGGLANVELAESLKK